MECTKSNDLDRLLVYVKKYIYQYAKYVFKIYYVWFYLSSIFIKLLDY